MASYDINYAGILWLADNEVAERTYSFTKACELFGEDAVRPLTRFSLYCIKARDKYVSLEQWKSESGVAPGTIRRRIQNGWPMLDAVNTPGTAWRAQPTEGKAATCGRPAQIWECGSRMLTIAQWSQE